MPRQESQGDVPVRVLGKDDMDRSLQEVLDSLGDMDSAQLSLLSFTACYSLRCCPTWVKKPTWPASQTVEGALYQMNRRLTARRAHEAHRHTARLSSLKGP